MQHVFAAKKKGEKMATKEKKKKSLGFGIALMLAITLGMGISGRLFVKHVDKSSPEEKTAVEEAVSETREPEESEDFETQLIEQFGLGEFEDILILHDQDIEPVKLAAVYVRDTASEMIFNLEGDDFIEEVKAYAAEVSTGRNKVKVVEGEYEDYHTITLMANRVIVDSIPVEVLRGYVEGDMTLEELNPEEDFSEPIVSGKFYIW